MMSRLLALLASLILSTSALAETARERLALPVDVVFGRADYEVGMRAGILQRMLNKDDYHMSVDLEAGTITFTSKKTIISAPVQVIGTYNTLDGTFLWGWDHPSIPKDRAADARLAREFGQKNKLPLFTTRKVECTQEQARQFTAVAMYLAGAEGAYGTATGETGSTLVFMTYGTIRMSPNK